MFLRCICANKSFSHPWAFWRLDEIGFAQTLVGTPREQHGQTVDDRITARAAGAEDRTSF